jgi:hyperosmotically inducible protein
LGVADRPEILFQRSPDPDQLPSNSLHHVNETPPQEKSCVYQWIWKTVKTFKVLVLSLGLLATVANSSVVRANDSTAVSSGERKVIRDANRKLQHAIRVELNKRKVDISNIRILARNGDVTLVGTVKDDRQIALAGNTAETVPGVKSLQNNLTLRVVGR